MPNGPRLKDWGWRSQPSRGLRWVCRAFDCKGPHGPSRSETDRLGAGSGRAACVVEIEDNCCRVAIRYRGRS